MKNYLSLLILSLFVFGLNNYVQDGLKKLEHESFVANITSVSPQPEKPALNPEPASAPEPKPSPVSFSATRLEQADTLLVKIIPLGGVKITGEFAGKPLTFLQTATGEVVAIIGVDARAKPGEYPLTVNLPEQTINKTITVTKRKFPVTELVVTQELEEKGYTVENIGEGIAKRDNPSINDVLQIFTPEYYFQKPFTTPLERIKIVGNYGNIRKEGEVSIQHLGVDLDARVGTPVYTTNDGVVAFTEELQNYGKTLIINHGLGIYSLYLHLSEFKKEKGARVAQDEVVALSGNSGYSIDPHLHFSVKLNGASVDPLRFIETTAKNL